MGMNADAHLAYGYDLGTGEDFKAAERSEYGAPKLPWLPVDEDGDSVYEDFGEEVEKLLLASVGFTEEWTPGCGARGYYDRKREAEKQIGVELAYSGHTEYAGWVLIAAGSDRWSEVMTVDLDELTNRPGNEGWDAKLADALAALGITPTQAGPKWVVFPSYG